MSRDCSLSITGTADEGVMRGSVGVFGPGPQPGYDLDAGKLYSVAMMTLVEVVARSKVVG